MLARLHLFVVSYQFSLFKTPIRYQLSAIPFAVGTNGLFNL